MAAKKKPKKSVLLRLLVLGVSVYMIVTLIGLWKNLETSRAKLSAYEEQYAAEQQEVEQLKLLLVEDSKTKLVEQAARERLGYVYSNEEVFIDISGN